MKKLILLFSLAMVSFTTVAQSKIGTINADYIVAQMPQMTEINEGLKTYNADLQKDLETSITNYENLVKTYQEGNETWTDEQRKEKESEIISLEKDINGFRQRATLMMQMKRNELTEPLMEQINEAMLKVIEEEGYTQIFHSGGSALAFSTEEADITQKVMQKLGIAQQ